MVPESGNRGPTLMENQWLTLMKRLRAVASTGMHYGRDAYDRERYAEIDQIATSMLSLLGNAAPERIRSLVGPSARGYETPKVDVRGAVIRRGRILLVREATDGGWTLPGGYADVGYSPAENVEKEVWEEAGLRVVADGLYAVRHKAKHAYDADVRDFYKLFFICRPIDDSEPAAPGFETTEVGFFSPTELPPLSTGRVVAEDISAAFEYVSSGRRRTLCD
jgi:ADP-ribose pyrophosphatase YjhB (NUDIX family)